MHINTKSMNWFRWLLVILKKTYSFRWDSLFLNRYFNTRPPIYWAGVLAEGAGHRLPYHEDNESVRDKNEKFWTRQFKHLRILHKKYSQQVLGLLSKREQDKENNDNSLFISLTVPVIPKPRRTSSLLVRQLTCYQWARWPLDSREFVFRYL
jgi:hypothetical protein